MSNIITFIYKLLLTKGDILKNSIFYVQKVCLQVRFWGAPTHADSIAGNFLTSCCNLKIIGLGAKLNVAFLLF